MSTKEDETQQLKSPQSLHNMIKKYGPGFVAISEESGRVLASGKDMNEVWNEVKDSPLFKENKVAFRHVPPPQKALVY